MEIIRLINSILGKLKQFAVEQNTALNMEKKIIAINAN